MTIRALQSKASIKGHPLHAMLVNFPIALYTSGVVSLIVFASAGDPFWYRASFTSLLAGAAMAVLSAVFGAIDLFLAIPRTEKRARNTGYIHAGLNVVSLAMFAGAGFSLLTAWQRPTGTEVWLPYTLPLTLGILGLMLTAAAAWFGYNLVLKHHVGVEDLAEAEPPMASAPAIP